MSGTLAIALVPRIIDTFVTYGPFCQKAMVEDGSSLLVSMVGTDQQWIAETPQNFLQSNLIYLSLQLWCLYGKSENRVVF